MASTQRRRVGLMTAGGDCPGLNAVIRAVVKSGIYQHDFEMIGIEDGFLGLIQNRMHVMSTDEVSNILTVGGTILGSSNKADPENHAVLENGRWVRRDVTEDVLAHCRQWNLDALIVIGGDGTMCGANHLIGRGLKIVGVPKTIDNDLEGTEVTFGHDTAVTIATEALDRVHTTASSHHRVMVVEIMGRYAGWLALRAGLASGSDVILIPEIPFDLDVVARMCQKRSTRGKRFTIIAAGEGAAPRGGDMVVDHRDEGSPDPIRLGGVAKLVAGEIEKRTGLESRSIVLGHVQRGGTPSPYDRILATTLAHHAVDLLAAGRFGELVVVRDGKISSLPIASIAGKVRKVPLDDPMIRAARGVDTCFGDT
ncbi:MAG: ATP-dependent 6-phosphofructokinase [Deltaproteobacteria bacterium]|nr:ATP-dependent 6-phosphofructokinase [Deltaproteobacteria bacterium]